LAWRSSEKALARGVTFAAIVLASQVLAVPSAHAVDRTASAATCAQLQGAAALGHDGDTVTVTVTGNIDMDCTVTVPAGVLLLVKSSTGGPYQLLRNAAPFIDPFFSLSSNGTIRRTALTITNLVLDGNKANVPENIYNRPLIKATAGDVVLGDGAILRNNPGSGTLYGGTSALWIEGNGTTGSVGGTAVISDNVSRFGGGIEVISGASLTISGQAVIQNNTSVSFGGGIDVNAANATITDSAKITGNVSDDGGGLSVMVPAGSVASVTANATINGNAQVSNNTARRTGGGIAANSQNTSQAQVVVTIAGSAKIRGNQAVQGGAVISATATVSLSGDAVVSGNSATATVSARALGGAFRIDKSALTLAGNSQVIDNKAVDLRPVDPGMGGAVNADGSSTVTITDAATVAGNSAYYGGGVAIFFSSSLSIGGSAILRQNTASFGGAICTGYDSLRGSIWPSGLITISGNTQIRGNTATRAGGGILTGPDRTEWNSVQISGSVSIASNSAPAGGGIAIGGVTPPSSQYNVLKVGPAVTFSDNSASAAYQLTASDKVAYYDPNILATVFTTPFQYGFNNFDILYSGGPKLLGVSYQPNGGAGPVPASGLGAVGESVGVLFSPAPTMPGYIFLGWSQDPLAKTPTYTQSGIVSFVMPDNLVTLYAVWQKDPAAAMPMYRIYNSTTGEHFYTSSPNEARANVNSGAWKYEGIGWFAPSSGEPVYRLAAIPGSGSAGHLFTLSTKERDAALASRNPAGQPYWKCETGVGMPACVGWYSGGPVPVYRAYYPGTGQHNYTTDLNEQRVITGTGSMGGWIDEKIGWYALRLGDPGAKLPA